jgi:hypothetical protein
MKIAYQNFNFRASTLRTIETVNVIIADYQRQGYDLTLRQLYYQLVSRDIIPNNQKEYDKLGNIVNDARLAGLIDWDAIVDRTRNLEALGHWESPTDIIRSAELGYRLDKWENQEYRPEVWIEKDALRGVVAGISQQLDIPHFACRGYSSQSEMWRAGQRMLQHIENGQIPYIIHLGDHDPSGVDMTRDIIDRLELFTGQYEGEGFHVKRIALNYDQVRQYNPPPNPAKLTDSRVDKYIAEYGRQSWELDALEPSVITALIEDEILSIRDEDKWDETIETEQEQKKELAKIRRNYQKVKTYLNGD